MTLPSRATDDRTFDQDSASIRRDPRDIATSLIAPEDLSEAGEPSDLSGILKAIAAEVSAKAANFRAGISAAFAARIAAAWASGLGRHQIIAMVAAIRLEQQGAMKAVADEAAHEMAARMARALREQKGAGTRPAARRRRSAGSEPR